MTLTTAFSPLATLRRPRLLLSAARFGLSGYDRDATLSRLLGGTMPRPGQAALDALIAAEARFDSARRAGHATYSVAAHVEVLTALLAEARLWLEARRVS